MLVIGGVTRLTGSGLSIVTWKPVVGAIPPLSDADWRDAFGAYQQTPQFRLMNSGMSLVDFKRIFFWEYVHRLIGRVLGFVFLVPVAYFAWKRALPSRILRPLAVAFALGAFQGFLGWFMVKSGLVDMPHVSHYRLAAHLSLALIVLGVLFWTWLDVGDAAPVSVSPALRFALRVVAALLALQIVYGAFTAGLHAGIGYNTFPSMHGQWTPPGGFRSPFEDGATVQWTHRVVGTLLVFAAGAVAVASRGAPKRARRAVTAVAHGALLQYGLGVTTLVLHVPLAAAALHQVGACLLWLAVLRALYICEGRTKAVVPDYVGSSSDVGPRRAT